MNTNVENGWAVSGSLVQFRLWWVHGKQKKFGKENKNFDHAVKKVTKFGGQMICDLSGNATVLSIAWIIKSLISYIWHAFKDIEQESNKL